MQAIDESRQHIDNVMSLFNDAELDNNDKCFLEAQLAMSNALCGLALAILHAVDKLADPSKRKEKE